MSPFSTRRRQWTALAALLVLAVVGVGLASLTLFNVLEQGSRQRHSLCTNQHAVVSILRLFLSEGTKQFQLRPVTSRAKRLELIAFGRRVAVLLDRADCPMPRDRERR